MSRLPLRGRLTLVFAVAMAVVLAGIGAFVYVRLADSLDEQIDEALQARLATLRTLPPGTTRLPGDDDDFAQVVAASGAVVAASPGLERTPLTRAGRGTVETDVRIGGETKRARLAVVGSASWRLIAGRALEDRDETLDSLLLALLVGGPVALLLASGAGYLVAGAALRPVERMRGRAAAISADTPGERLPLPEARDEIHRLGETLNAMLARLEAGVARERRFVADASHELRTPLALLQTELELALRRERQPEELRAALVSAREEVDRLVRLAEDLLVLASSEEGKLPLRREDVRVRELLDAVASRSQAKGRPLEVRAEDLTVSVDRLRLEQALGNLVDNAVRHGAGTIALRARRADGQVELAVEDEGGGFPADFAPRAFDRFSRGDEARTAGGAGLGLALVRAVAEAHGGEAEITGVAEVTLRLPSS